MTLELATAVAMQAAINGDVASLDRAMKQRADAIATLRSSPPSENLAMQIRAAIQAGQELGEKIAALKIRLGRAHARLTQMRSGLVGGLAGNRRRRLDCRG